MEKNITEEVTREVKVNGNTILEKGDRIKVIEEENGEMSKEEVVEFVEKNDAVLVGENVDLPDDVSIYDYKEYGMFNISVDKVAGYKVIYFEGRHDDGRYNQGSDSVWVIPEDLAGFENPYEIIKKIINYNSLSKEKAEFEIVDTEGDPHDIIPILSNYSDTEKLPYRDAVMEFIDYATETIIDYYFFIIGGYDEPFVREGYEINEEELTAKIYRENENNGFDDWSIELRPKVDDDEEL